MLLVVPKLGSGEELKKRAEKKNETSRMKSKEKPYLRIIHFVRAILSQCLKRWQGRGQRVTPEDDIEHGIDLDQEEQNEIAQTECLSSSDFSLTGITESGVSPVCEPCGDMVPSTDSPIIQVVGEPGVQSQSDLSSVSSELPPAMPGTPVS